MSEVTREVFEKNPVFSTMKPMDYGSFLVISLGTGTQKKEQKYSAKAARKWGVLGWLVNKGNSPLVDVFSQASADMVDIHISLFFQTLRSSSNYLRIQVRSNAYFFSFIFFICYIGDSNSNTLTRTHVRRLFHYKNRVQTPTCMPVS